MPSITFDNLLIIIMIIYIIYIFIKKSEHFEDTFKGILSLPSKKIKTESKKECSDVSINQTIFEYSLSKLNQIKTPN